MAHDSMLKFVGRPQAYPAKRAPDLRAEDFQEIANRYGAGNIFAFFAVMMVLQLLWVAIKMPETKGRSLEEIQKDLQKSHD